MPYDSEQDSSFSSNSSSSPWTSPSSSSWSSSEEDEDQKQEEEEENGEEMGLRVRSDIPKTNLKRWSQKMRKYPHPDLSGPSAYEKSMAKLRAKKQMTMREAVDSAKLDPKNTIPIAKEKDQEVVQPPPLKRIRTKSSAASF